MKYVLMKSNKVDVEYIRKEATKYANEKHKLVVKRTKILNNLYTTLKNRNKEGDQKTVAKLQTLWKQLLPVLYDIAELERVFFHDDTVLNNQGRRAHQKLFSTALSFAQAAEYWLSRVKQGESDVYEEVSDLLKLFGQSSGTKSPPGSSKQFIPSSAQLLFRIQL